MLVEVVGVDVARAVLVADVRDLAHERHVLDERGDEDVLTLVDVGADLDRELCERAKTSVLGHRGNHIDWRVNEAV